MNWKELWENAFKFIEAFIPKEKHDEAIVSMCVLIREATEMTKECLTTKTD